MRKPRRQPSGSNVEQEELPSVPRIAPPQYVPLTAMSTRPRYWAGIISSIAELIAAYSPPMPIPATNRVT